MSLPKSKLSIVPLSEERRRFQRVRVNLLGRYMLADRREFPCQVTDMSPGGMALIAPVSGKAGERVIAYIEHIGRLEGTIVRLFANGFAVAIVATPRKRDKIAAQLTWLANRHALGLPEDRRHERVVPREQASVLVLPDGRKVSCRVLDVSLSGAAVSAEIRPPVGTAVTLGKTQARVVRHLEDGFAVEFLRLQRPELLERNVTGS